MEMISYHGDAQNNGVRSMETIRRLRVEERPRGTPTFLQRLSTQSVALLLDERVGINVRFGSHDT